MVYDPLSLAADSGYVFLFITLYKTPYLDLGKIYKYLETIQYMVVNDIPGNIIQPALR